MGEEKPDEELMGKRKLAPRLSTDTFDVDNVRMSGLTAEYTSCAKKCFEGLGPKAGMDKFFIWRHDYGTIGVIYDVLSARRARAAEREIKRVKNR